MIPKDLVSTHLSKEDLAISVEGMPQVQSSESEFHFEHYIAGIQSDHIFHFHALKATLIMKRGIVLERWARGLLVMFEKFSAVP